MQPFIEFKIPSYSLFAIIGLFCMMVTIYFRSESRNILFINLLLLYAMLVIGAGFGSKLLFILTKIPEIVKALNWKYTIYIIITSGFVFYGGLLGAILSLYIFSKIKQIPFIELGNMVAPGFAIFHAWGRIGCFFAGCCYGKAASWGVPLFDEPDVLRIPIQLIESLGIIIILCILLLYDWRKKEEINLLIIYLQLYSIFRFILEFFRGDIIRGIWAGLSTSQWISIFIVSYIVFYRIKIRRVKTYKR